MGDFKTSNQLWYRRSVNVDYFALFMKKKREKRSLKKFLVVDSLVSVRVVGWGCLRYEAQRPGLFVAHALCSSCQD